MTWQFTDDVEEYASQVVPLLAADPVRHTVPLSVVESARARNARLDDPELFGWWTRDRGVAGAVSHTPPHDVLLGIVPDEAMRPLVHALHHELGRHIQGVDGAAADAAHFAAIRTHDLGGRAELRHAMRLHRLEQLAAPASPPPGGARPATSEDRTLLVTWFEAFAREAGVPFSARVVDERLSYGGLTIWSDAAGQPVSLAGRSRPASGVVRVGPVYTPPEHRNRGLGSAVTHAVTAAALSAGALDVVLFTDVANATSNAIYQRLGFRAVSDTIALRFVN